MKTKKLFLIFASLTSVLIGFAFFENSFNKEFTKLMNVNSSSQYYLQAKSLSTTNNTLTTDFGNIIEFNVVGFDNKTFAPGGEISNITPLSGLKYLSISFDTTDAELSISYGWSYNNYVVNDGTVGRRSQSYRFREEMPSFFKVKNNSDSDVRISWFEISYSCVESIPIHYYDHLDYKYDPYFESYSVVYCDYDAENVIIPSTIDNKPVTRIEALVFSDHQKLKSLVIPDTVTFIGNNAFGNCESLETLVLSNNLKEIEQEICICCSSLTSIVIPDGVTKIHEWAFAYCSSLTSIVIPESVTFMHGEVFEECPSSLFNSYDNGYYLGPDSNPYAFFIRVNDYELESISFHSQCKYICPNSLMGSYIRSVVVPEGVISLGYGAFIGCEYLTTVSIPNTLVDLSGYLFDDLCLSIVYNEYDNAYYIGNDLNPYLFLACAKNSTISSCLINNQCRFISSFAFQSCSYLSSIVIPNSVTSIGACAFSACESLESVTLSENLNIIRHYTFESCTSLLSITIPNSVTEIQYEAFSNCTSLSNVVVSNNVILIEREAFCCCRSLSAINIPNSVEKIEEGVFSNCNSLLEIVIHSSVNFIGGYCFNGCDSLTIYCELQSKPYLWDEEWNNSNCPVIWGYKVNY